MIVNVLIKPHISDEISDLKIKIKNERINVCYNDDRFVYYNYDLEHTYCGKEAVFIFNTINTYYNVGLNVGIYLYINKYLIIYIEKNNDSVFLK